MNRARSLRSSWPQYLAISPFYLLFTVFLLGPTLFSLYLAFHRWDGIGEMQYVGLDQFRFLIEDATFWLSVRNTLVIWVLSTVPMLFFALVLAALLNNTKRLVGFYRVALFIPNITSVVAVAIVFGALFANNSGLVNITLQGLGLSGVPWLTDPWAIKVVIAMLMTWQWTGYNALIYLAGMQSIPSELYEAAKIDGAGPVRAFLSITIPMLRPIILFTVVVSTITGMQSFTEPQVLFGNNSAVNANSGGPGQAGLTMVLYFYRTAFGQNDYGYGAAIAWAVFLIVMVFTILNWRLVQRRAD
ncbi:carbohydrate ABC transporter permease [Actinoplanes derwentensis]|uniref:Cellobiose transport system permease protein n=1 Tax=Actinoplanes derwentensis TaxID=113562 RepID=A0A1H1SNC1_9ACTN|nr:sugar ABC transporter permease [Actinoplanes derwentensis]GID83253.1 cytochrome c biogenesis protein [Actinoplanes derwentensis]SDS49494.1 cellobiose transport system permease protein [Actinoplanes derwentensis]